MDTKKCLDCGGVFKIDMFAKKNPGRCNQCYKETRHAHYIANRERLLFKSKEYQSNMSDEQKEHSKKVRKNYYETNKPKILERKKKWEEENKEYMKQVRQDYHIKNRNAILLKMKNRRKNMTTEMKEHYRSYRKTYYNVNKENIHKKRKEWEEIPHNKIATRLRSRIRSALTGKIKKVDYTENLLGISFEDFKSYISSKLIDGMSWDNYGTWHIDHILPCTYFNLENEIDQKICFNYQNLQPLWGVDNIKKMNNIIIENPEEHIKKIKDSL